MTIGRFLQIALIGASVGLVLISALAATNSVPGSNAGQSISGITVDRLKPQPDCNGITVTVLVTGGNGGNADELILRLCKPLLCFALCFLGFGQTASEFVCALAGREEGRGKHGLPGLEHTADLPLEPLRLLDLGARASAGIEVGLHALQGIG